MNITVTQGNIAESAADTLVVNLFEGVTTPGGATAALDRALNGAVSELIAGGDLRGKKGEVAVLYPRGALPARRVLVAGLGSRDRFDLDAVRQTAAAAMRRARDLGARSVATIVHGGGVGGLEMAAAAQATVEGSLLSLYRFGAFKNDQNGREPPEALTLVEFAGEKVAEIRAAVQVAEAVVAGVALARDLVNMPPNVGTPSKMAEVARDMAGGHGMAVTIGDREWAARHNMGAFLGVARGAGEPPAFIILEHNGERADLATIVLVGKGVTFDTGGISIKPTQDMERMKSDMAGAATVLGMMKTAALLDLPLRLIGLCPCTENMPDAHAYRPADVLKASNGKTIEIISTDAEGRLLLADALVYAGRYAPDAVIDLATLTGACVIALGKGMAAGLFSNDDELCRRLTEAGTASHERVWRLPLWEEYQEAIKSETADIKNSGGRWSGVSSSAIFLKQFTDYPWAHLDIAGMALADKDSGYTPAGATGFGVRLLAEFLRGWPIG
jgi:leucyl aminopeptidase